MEPGVRYVVAESIEFVVGLGPCRPSAMGLGARRGGCTHARPMPVVVLQEPRRVAESQRRPHLVDLDMRGLANNSNLPPPPQMQLSFAYDVSI